VTICTSFFYVCWTSVKTKAKWVDCFMHVKIFLPSSWYSCACRHHLEGIINKKEVKTNWMLSFFILHFPRFNLILLEMESWNECACRHQLEGIINRRKNKLKSYLDFALTLNPLFNHFTGKGRGEGLCSQNVTCTKKNCEYEPYYDQVWLIFLTIAHVYRYCSWV
jgi:hypothetical protein